MATKKRGPTKGARVLVELPFGTEVKAAGKKPGKSKYIRVKEGIAKELGFKPVTTMPTVTVEGKKRVANIGSYRRVSVTLIFDKPRTIKGSTGTYASVNLPLGSGCTVTDAVQYFEKHAKGVVALRTASGQVYRWDFSA
ncbi:hypothetical protein [Nostoc sp.]|uniref:hypothetical protein n=1 Tax=Nostoc sp. TaxID=1180 RepID=UPI002FF66D74